MKIQVLFCLSIALIVISGCSKEKDTDANRRKFPPPHWQALNTASLAYSMTAVIGISDSLNETVTAKDEVAAFIGEECRGVGVYI